MPTSLLSRLHDVVVATLHSYPDAWMVWCDPRGDWLPLLEQTAKEPSGSGFTLLHFEDATAGNFGSPQLRAELQTHIDAGEPILVVAPVSVDRLGWLWAQALLAERIYDRSLRDQLRDWGWRPYALTVGDDEVATLARLHLHEDPADWGGGGLQPDIPLLLEVLAAKAQPKPEQRLLLDLSIEHLGLPPLDSADMGRWRSRCLARLLVTEVHQRAPHLVPESHELVIPAGHREAALHTLSAWEDSNRLSPTLAEAVIEADRIAVLGTLMVQTATADGPFLSQVAEQSVFSATCSRLAQLQGQILLETLAGLTESIARHAQGFWGYRVVHPKVIPWGELGRLSQAARLLLAAGSSTAWSTPQDAVDWFTTGGWRLDQAGLEIMRDLVHPTPDLLALIGPLRAAYRARWEQTMIDWSEVWTSAGSPTPNLPTAGAWLLDRLERARPTAILVVDALRYDLGCVLAARINHQEGVARASVTPARAPIPSITALGMGMALPIPEHQLVADLVDGKWQLHQKGMADNLSVAEKRRTWWVQQGGVQADAVLDMAAVRNGPCPRPEASRSRLLVNDATIDKLGHDDQLEAQGSDLALERYLGVIERLRDAGWLRILVVTDHGFLHWPSSEEKNAPYPLPEPVYASRRALAYPAAAQLAGPQTLAPGSKWRIAAPHGAASYRAYGGLGYFHGGASLQEWVIPCITVEWPMQARPLRVAIEPIPTILSQRPKVVLTAVSDTLLVEESIPRQVEVVVRHAQQQTILFRSQTMTVAPDQSQVTLALTVTPNLAADRGTSVMVQVRDAKTEEVLDACSSVLMIELTDW